MKKLLFILLFAGCKFVREGVVLEKIYEPERSYLTTEYDVIMDMPKLVTKTDDEDFYLVIEGVVEGDTLVQKRSVSSQVYYKIKVGDYYREK